MIPPNTKNHLISTVEKYAPILQKFKNSNPVIMIGQLKLDRIDQKVKKQAEKLNEREVHKDVKSEGGRPRKYEKRKAAITYKSYTVEFKRKLIQKIRQLDLTSNLGLSKIIRSKARELNIHPKNIFRWFHTKEIKKKEGGRKALYPEMEERLAQFIINNPTMKRKHILRQAKQIMEDLKIPGREYFNFSKGWYERFRERLVRRKIISGKIQAKSEFAEDSDSDFDDSDYGVKKEEQFLKQEQGVKVEHQFGNEYDSDDQQMAQDLKEQKPTKINVEDLILNFNSYICDQKERRQENYKKKTQKDQKEESKKEEQCNINYEKEEAKTDESEQRTFSQTISIEIEQKRQGNE